MVWQLLAKIFMNHDSDAGADALRTLLTLRAIYVFCVNPFFE